MTAGLTLVLLAPLSASATCLMQCDGDLIDAKSCDVLSDGSFINGSVATFTLTCETCCSPPGGPLVCNPTEATPDMLAVSDPSSPTPLEASCGPVTGGCEGAWTCDVGEADGKYTITANSMVVTWFSTASGAPCTTNEDCAAAEVCMGGTCTYVPNSCETDLDCSFSEVCTGGQCMPSMTGCMSDLDCSFSEVCMAGVCVQAGTTCATDLDCSFSEICMAGLCVENSKPCSSDADCPGVCGICLAGSCFGGGDIECEVDDDCGDGATCLLDPDEVCLNQCVPFGADGVDAFDGADGTDGAGSCVDDEDCGSCAVCVGGECKGLGLVSCMIDTDCGAGNVCDQHPTDQCKNACVPEGTTDGAVDATDGAVDATDGAVDATDGDDGTDAIDGETDVTDATDGATDTTDGATDATDGATDGATDATDGAADATDGDTDAADAPDGSSDSTDDATDGATDDPNAKTASASCGAVGSGAPSSMVLLLAVFMMFAFTRRGR